MTASAARAYEGGCHCGRVRFRVSAELRRVSECNCSICAKKGILHLIVSRDAFELIAGADALTTYRFNTGVARHQFCRYCGIHAFYVPRSDPDKIDAQAAAIDRAATAFNGIDLADAKVKAVRDDLAAVIVKHVANLKVMASLVRDARDPSKAEAAAAKITAIGADFEAEKPTLVAAKQAMVTECNATSK